MTDGVNNPSDRVMDLYRGIDEFLDTLRIPPAERAEVEKNLTEAIAADLLVRLGGRLSDEEREKLASATNGEANTDLSAVAGFFRERFSEDELADALTASTESVLSDFTAEMGK
jgi:hypothetical protein